MAVSQNRLIRTARGLARRGVPPAFWNAASADEAALHSASNRICFSLLVQQGAGTVAVFSSALLLWVFRYFVMQRALGITLTSAQGELAKNVLSCAEYIIYMFCTLVLMAFVLRERPFHTAARMPIRRPYLLPVAAVITLVFYFGGIYLVDLILHLLSLIHIEPNLPSMEAPKSVAAYVFYALQISVLAPLLEEFTFRGLILRRLQPYGNAFAIIVSALLFGMLHGNVMQIPFAFAVGLAIGYFVVQLGSVWVGVILHCLVNSTSLVSEQLSIHFGDEKANLIFFIFAGALVVFAIPSVFLLVSEGCFKRGERSAVPLGMRTHSFFVSPGFLVFLTLILITVVLTLKIV